MDGYRLIKEVTVVVHVPSETGCVSRVSVKPNIFCWMQTYCCYKNYFAYVFWAGDPGLYLQAMEKSSSCAKCTWKNKLDGRICAIRAADLCVRTLFFNGFSVLRLNRSPSAFQFEKHKTNEIFNKRLYVSLMSQRCRPHLRSARRGECLQAQRAHDDTPDGQAVLSL